MAQRSDLHQRLVGLLGSAYVYFQPPENFQMQYDCIVYNRDRSGNNFADNFSYARKKRYQVIVIVKDPDSDIPDKVEDLPMCTLNRSFVADQLYHYVFTLFF